MSTALPQTTAAQRFGQFTGDVIGNATAMLGKLESFTVSQVTKLASNSDSLNRAVDVVKQNQDLIGRALFWVGCVYNAWRSMTAFAVGAAAGYVASAASFPVDLPSLRNGELLGSTSEHGFAGPKTLFGLAAVNWYLGDTLLDDMFFGAFAGLLFGNMAFHATKESFLGKGVEKVKEVVGNIASRVLPGGNNSNAEPSATTEASNNEPEVEEMTPEHSEN